MKTSMKKSKRIGTVILAATTAIGLFVASPHVRTASFIRHANASEGPRVIEITAKKYEFSPSDITLKKGEPVILRLTSEDRQHGFFLRPFKIDADIAPGKTTDVAVTPDTAGDYTIICDHYCGTGHGNMKMKLTVTE
jgi:cytochrome c oxidase subunit 2